METIEKKLIKQFDWKAIAALPQDKTRMLLAWMLDELFADPEDGEYDLDKPTDSQAGAEIVRRFRNLGLITEEPSKETEEPGLSFLEDFPEVSVKVDPKQDRGYRGGYYTAQGSLTLRVGEAKYSLPYWSIAGWLQPGAHQNLDGSGLPQWGDSQPGGWVTCDGDSQDSGRPQVEIPAADQDGWVHRILISANSGQVTKKVDAFQIPEWSKVYAQYNHGKISTDQAEEYQRQLAEKIEEAIDDADLSCPEPDSKVIYNYLGETDELEGLPLAIGEFEGAGVVAAWKSDDVDEFHHYYWPTKDDVEEITRYLEGSLRQAIQKLVDEAKKEAEDS